MRDKAGDKPRMQAVAVTNPDPGRGNMKQARTQTDLEALPVGAKLYSPKTHDVWWKRDGSRGGPWWEGSGGMYSRTSDFLERQGPTDILHSAI